jgi:hypothetical protein
MAQILGGIHRDGRRPSVRIVPDRQPDFAVVLEDDLDRLDVLLFGAWVRPLRRPAQS